MRSIISEASGTHIRYLWTKRHWFFAMPERGVFFGWLETGNAVKKVIIPLMIFFHLLPPKTNAGDVSL